MNTKMKKTCLVDLKKDIALSVFAVLFVCMDCVNQMCERYCVMQGLYDTMCQSSPFLV